MSGAIDISGIWDYAWNGNPCYVERHVYTPIPTDEFEIITRVRFQREKDPSCFQYIGSYFYRELPERSDPVYPYNSRWHVRIMPSTSGDSVYQYTLVSLLQDGYSSAKVSKVRRAYDTHEVGAGFLRDHNHPLWEGDRIMFGIKYNNNGNNAVWLFPYNEEETRGLLESFSLFLILESHRIT